jgi:predicted short-subunit dehydrogenase-like oxidoreductase (DUF2520 family)
VTANRPARLSIGVVSAGRVGAVVGAAWAAAGHHVVATSGVSRESVRRAAALLPDVPLLPPDEVAAQADLVLLAVPDDVLPGLVRGLAAAGSFRAGQIVVHTSGAHGVSVLAPAAEHDVLPLALHPVMTFTGRVEDVARLHGASVGVTAGADAAGWPVGEALVVEMGADPVRIPEAVRPLYHAALAHGANHLVTLVSQAMDLLRESGATDPAATLRPLLTAALDNALTYGDAALTGPIVRGDVETVRAHLADIARTSPGTLGSYVALARATANRAVVDGRLLPLRAAKLVSILNDALPAGSPASPRVPAHPATGRGA